MLTRTVLVAVIAALAAAVPQLEAQTRSPSSLDDIQIHSFHVQGNVWMIVGGAFNAAVRRQ